MIKVEVIENFQLGKFNELKNIKRKSTEKEGFLFVGDIFECTEELAKYLLNETSNPAKRAFVRIIEIIPEEKKEQKVKTTRKTRKTIEKK